MKAVSDVSFYTKKFKESSEANTSVVGYQEVLKHFWPHTGLVDRQNCQTQRKIMNDDDKY